MVRNHRILPAQLIQFLDNYHHLNQHSTTVPASVAVKSSVYGSLCLDMKGDQWMLSHEHWYYTMLLDDYQHLDNCTLRPSSKGVHQL